MSHVRFNRHEIFTAEDHNFHSQTIREVEDFYLNKDANPWLLDTPLNNLEGIWDGFLYDGIVEHAQAAGFPAQLVDRIEATVNLIKFKLQLS